MAAWLISALAMIAGRPAARAGIAAVRRFGPAAAVGTGVGVGVGALATGDIPFIGPAEAPRRRRRRRALTQGDRNDIAFITATLGSPAGKAFALIIASRIG